MKRYVFVAALVWSVGWSTPTLLGFCGFYVSKADTKLFNKASQVVLVRDGDRTVMTMVNDFKGSLKEFAVVIPVPTFLKREQIHVGEKTLVDHLDAYSAPRLVEYFDANPCQVRTLNEYALSEIEGGKVIASETEEQIYEALGLAWIPPVLREDAGEIEARPRASKNRAQVRRSSSRSSGDRPATDSKTEKGA